jgi:hypothetical protein
MSQAMQRRRFFLSLAYCLSRRRALLPGWLLENHWPLLAGFQES